MQPKFVIVTLHRRLGQQVGRISSERRVDGVVVSVELSEWRMNGRRWTEPAWFSADVVIEWEPLADHPRLKAARRAGAFEVAA